MFNVGDRVKCNSGGCKGMVGTVLKYSTKYPGKPRILVQFDSEFWSSEFWEHRFSLEVEYSKEELLIKKIKQMESRQKWQGNQQS